MPNVNEIQILLSTTSFYCRLDRAPLLTTQFESLQPLSTLPENTARQAAFPERIQIAASETFATAEPCSLLRQNADSFRPCRVGVAHLLCQVSCDTLPQNQACRAEYALSRKSRPPCQGKLLRVSAHPLD